MERSRCPVHPEYALEPGVVHGQDQAWGYEGRFSYGRCPRCKTLVLDPRPTPDEMGQYYGRYYDDAMCAAYRKPFGRRPAEQAGILDLLRAKALMARQAKDFGPITSSMHVLDVGCGIGGILRFVQDLSGASVRGVDFDPACATLAEDIHSVTVDTGTLQDAAYNDAAFDMVTLFHSLEHVYEPAAELAEIARITKPGGALHVDVPSPGLLGRFFAGRWCFLQPPTHLYHYQESALRELLEGAGFEVVRTTRPWLPVELVGSLALAFGVDGAIPLAVLPARTLAERAQKALLGGLLLADLPITRALALLQQGGVLGAVARRRAD